MIKIPNNTNICVYIKIIIANINNYSLYWYVELGIPC